MPSVISTSPATRRQNRWIFSERTGKITVKKFSLHGKKNITAGDTVIMAGDISWATHLEDALSDLKTLSALPGRKIIVRGNHDYWWNTVSKMKRMTDNALNLFSILLYP